MLHSPIVLLLIFIISLGLLLKGADLLVDGSASIAKRFNVSPLIIGLTIVSLGTSLPEFVISLMAVISGSTGISVGNIIGSNIANIGLILGLSAMISPLSVQHTMLYYEMPFMVTSVIVYMIIANDMFIYGKPTLAIENYDGLLFLCLLLFFFYYLYDSIKKNHAVALEVELLEELPENAKGSILKYILFVILGIVMLFGGGRFFVFSSVHIARILGIPETFIGLTIVSIGTSLPELFTSVTASFKKEADIAVGNVVGSNIFNILFVFGIVSLVKTIDVDSDVYFVDSVFMVAFTLCFVLFATTSFRVSRKEGLILFVSYILYLVILILRNVY
ncbi:MAG: sodium:calcium antiporter [Nitrospirae bacterium]|nr:MAG: sodium:calcium antiporter [Nitrospirota bacterium]